MRKAIVILALVAISAISTGGASATVGGGSIDKAYLTVSGDVWQITGTIRCDAHETFLLRVNVRDSNGATAIGRVSGSCTGATEDWKTKTVQTQGTFNCGEPLAGHLQAHSSDGDSENISDKAQTACV